MEALNDKGFDFIKGRLEVLFKDLSGHTGGGFAPEQYQKIVNDYADMKGKLDHICVNMQNPNSGAGPADTLNHHHNTGLNLDAATGYSKGIGMNSTLNAGYQASFALTGNQFNNALQPPTARVNQDQSVSGYSHKFDSNLVVTGKNGDEKVMDAKD